MKLTFILDTSYLVSLGFDFFIAVHVMGDGRACEIGRGTLAALFRELTHPEEGEVPVGVNFEDGPGVHDLTARRDRIGEAVLTIRREVLRRAAASVPACERPDR